MKLFNKLFFCLTRNIIVFSFLNHIFKAENVIFNIIFSKLDFHYLFVFFIEMTSINCYLTIKINNFWEFFLLGRELLPKCKRICKLVRKILIEVLKFRVCSDWLFDIFPIKLFKSFIRFKLHEKPQQLNLKFIKKADMFFFN